MIIIKQKENNTIPVIVVDFFAIICVFIFNKVPMIFLQMMV